MDRIIGKDHHMSITIEMPLGEIIIQRCKTIEVEILEEDIEIIIIETTTVEEVEVSLGTGNIQVILEEMIEVIVGQDQVQELAVTETELDA